MRTQPCYVCGIPTDIDPAPPSMPVVVAMTMIRKSAAKEGITNRVRLCNDCLVGFLEWRANGRSLPA